MHEGDQPSAGTDTAPVRHASPPAGQQDRPASRAPRLWAALAWTAGGAALFALFFRVSLTMTVDSDAANNALQAWDLLHGHLLLHGWVTGDATFYAFELPVIAFVEIFFGLHAVTMHVATALIYLIVAACAAAIGVTGSRGASRVARAAVVVTVLAAPALVNADRWIPLATPDHMGTSVFLLVCCLLVDRATQRRWMPPLLCVILVAGQLSDVTVRYVTVPAVAVVCAYRLVAQRKIRSGDAAALVAAIASLPLATGARAAMRHFGAYLMPAPKTSIAPVSRWPHNAAMTWHALRVLFGTVAGPANFPTKVGPLPAGMSGLPTGIADRPAGLAAVFGFACLLAAAAGLLRVLWRWRTATRAEQILALAILANLGVYLLSTIAFPRTSHEISGVLPCGAVLAARALVPARIDRRLTALVASGVAVIAALLPLSLVAATQPTATPPMAQLSAWLSGHGLTYGLGGYWNSSATTLQSGNQVQVRPVNVGTDGIVPFPWETNTEWFDPSRHDANFVVVGLGSFGPSGTTGNAQEVERVFGKPAAIGRVGDWSILIYHKNLLKQLEPVQLGQTS